jgi:hypothetical protein
MRLPMALGTCLIAVVACGQGTEKKIRDDDAHALIKILSRPTGDFATNACIAKASIRVDLVCRLVAYRMNSSERQLVSALADDTELIQAVFEIDPAVHSVVPVSDASLAPILEGRSFADAVIHAT